MYLWTRFRIQALVISIEKTEQKINDTIHDLSFIIKESYNVNSFLESTIRNTISILELQACNMVFHLEYDTNET